MNKPNYGSRKSTRFNSYDYASTGYYFITINAKEFQYIFGKIKNGVMYPNKLGEIIQKEWEYSATLRTNIKLHEYVVMPNHFHGIIEICYSKGHKNIPGEFRAPSHSIGAVIRGFKGAVTRRNNALGIGNEKGIWQVNYYDRIIRDQQELFNVKNYIENNVKKW